MWAAEPSLTNDELRSITLLIIVTPEHAVEMFRMISGAQLCVVPNAGHGAMPKETILTFLQEEPARSSGRTAKRHSAAASTT